MGLLKTELITAPTVEPFDLDEAKEHLAIDPGDPTFDDLLSGLRLAARDHVEAVTNRRLVSQTWKAYYDDWPTTPYDSIVLPYPPLVSVPSTGVVYTDSDGDSTTLPSTKWATDTVSEPGRVVLGYNDEWPTTILNNRNPISVEFVCGYSTGATVPKGLTLGMKMLIGHWFENREASIVGQSVNRIPLAFEAVVAPYRVYTVPK